MLDVTMRARLLPVWDLVAAVLARVGVTPLALTLTGLTLAIGAAVAAGFALWPLAVVLWLVSRVPDGVDGPLARLIGQDSEFGGWADYTSDMVAYGSFVVGCAIGNPDATVPLLVLLLTYYINAGSLLAYSAAADRAEISPPDGRTFHFTRGLAEGTETIVAHALLALFPLWMSEIAWVFAAMVVITIGQRIQLARTTLPRAHDRRGADATS
jgi:phosphatidylglycerophosphate synthase